MKNKFIVILIILALFFINIVFADSVKLDFVNVDIREVARFMSEITNKTILVGDKVSGRITLLSASEITPNQAWKIFLKALISKGFIVQQYSNYVYILSGKDKMGHVININKSKRIPVNQMITLIYPLKYVKAQSILNTIKPLISASGTATLNVNTNTIIVKDNGYNIKNIVSVIKNIDTKRHFIVKRLYKLKYADAQEVAKVLSNSYRNDRNFFSFVADSQSNHILVSAPYDKINDIAILIKTLDVKPKVKKKHFYVYYLQNAKADQLLKILKNMNLQKIFENKELKEKNKNKSNTTNYNSSTNYYRQDIFQISADEETNSLIVYTTKEDYQILKGLFKQLDIKRKQIMVKAYIVEVSLKRLKELGIKWHYATKKGLVTFEGVSSLVDFYKNVTGDFQLGLGGISNKGVDVNIGNQKLFFPDVAVFLKFLSKDSDFNLISSPNISTVNNKKASIKVGSVVPYATGIKFDSNGNPIITYDYKDIGLNLSITPHISKSNQIRLEIDQDIQEITDLIKSNLGSMQYVVPITSRRQISTTITVKNGQTIVIGGLISDKKMKKMYKVPLLSDIPLIGYFFKHKSTTKEKTSLFIFLTPYIINKPQDINTIKKVHEKIQKEVNKYFKKTENKFFNKKIKREKMNKKIKKNKNEQKRIPK